MAAIDLAALPPTIVVPGIAAWLGWTPPEPDDSVDSYEAYLNRLTEEAA
ncbi:hypothetical protein ABIE67_007840 [Streptomyces sp. V4I8]